MAIATKIKPKTAHHKKRTAGHHRQSKQYVKSYWPYLPLVAIVALGLFINSTLSHPKAVLGSHTNLSNQALLNDTNDVRSSNGKATLQLNEQLNQAAQAKANDMVTKNYWSHVSPSGQQPWTLVTTTGYQYRAVGENLAYGFDAANTTLRAWTHSTEHQTNLLNGLYSDVGFGVAQSPNFMGSGPETVIVALYAQPAGGFISGESASAATPSANSVVRAQTVAFAPSTSSLLIGLVGALAVIFVFVRHGIAWRKLLNRGEAFALAHPLLDMALISLAMVAVILNHTVGFIH